MKIEREGSDFLEHLANKYAKLENTATAKGAITRAHPVTGKIVRQKAKCHSNSNETLSSPTIIATTEQSKAKQNKTRKHTPTPTPPIPPPESSINSCQMVPPRSF